MVGFSHVINNLKPSKNIKQEEPLPDPDFPEYSTPLVNSSIPDFDFIDEWLKETDSMDTQVSLKNDEAANGGNPIEVKTELLCSMEIPVVQETCKESIGIDSSIEIALEKVSLVGTSESSDILDMNSEAVVTSGSRDCLLEKNLMVSEGGGNPIEETDSMDTQVSLKNDEAANGGNPIEVKTELLGSMEIPVVQETCKESIGIDSSIEIALEKVSLVGTSESSDILDMNSKAVVTSGSRDCLLEKNLMVSEGGRNPIEETDSMDTQVSLKNDEAANGGNPIEVKTELLGSMEIPVVQETCKESIGIDSSIEIALEKVSLVGTSESSDILDMNSKAVVTSGSRDCLLEKNLMVSEGGGNPIEETDSMDTQVSLKNDEAANGGNPIEVKTELLGSMEIPVVQETCKESIGIDSSIEIALEKVSLVGTSESSDILDMNSEAVVTSGSRDCLLENNLMVSEGGGNPIEETDSMDTQVSLKNDEAANGGNPIEVKTELLGSMEIPVVQETCKESIGIDSSIEIALEKVSLVGTSESSDILDMNSEAVVTSGSRDCLLEKNLMVSEGGGNPIEETDSMDTQVSLKNDEAANGGNPIEVKTELLGSMEIPVVQETCKESIGIDSSIEIALEKVSLVGTSESADILDMNSEAVVTSGSRDCLLEKNLMVSEGGGNDVSLVDDPTKSDNNVDEEELIGESDGDEKGFSVKGPIKSKNEVQDLPPVPKVDLTLEPHHQTLPVGVVLTMMDAKVIVEGVEKHNPLNEGSILWITECRSVLGLVDEIFGPVKNPYYVVRYNSKEEVPAGISEGTLISFVVEFADHVLNDKNIYKKGYDASGENDEELTDEAEFSDDEKEAEYKRMQRMAKRGPSDDKKHGKRDFVEKKKFQQKPRNVNNNQTSFPPSSVPHHQIHGGSGSSPSPFGTGMTNDFRPPFGPSTAQVPQAHSGPAPQQHSLRPNMGPALQQHPMPSNMGPALQQHLMPSNMGAAQQQHPLPSNMGIAQQQHLRPSNMGVAQQQHPLPSNMVWPNGQPYQQNVGFANGFPMNAMPYVSYQQPQPFYQPQMFTGFSSGPPMPQHYNPSQRPILQPMPYGPSNIPPGMPPVMPVFMAQPGFNQGPIRMGFQGFPPRPHMNPGEQGVPPQGSPNEHHMNVGEQDTQSQVQGPSNDQINGVQPPSTQGNFSAQNRFNNRGAPRGRRPYRRGGGRGYQET
ncbi:hypothetical protein C5167_039386 [Papaver somniferum]|uniref:H/ACA ribonucleoprotein complex non-core subunit NAF1 n=1 Tax=Papaver somniferum TaxID=3469 RepID=A0A4Y7IG71_PAPSO|nr:hypothetical protein C5167_039386 [Papaver somniferum]